MKRAFGKGVDHDSLPSIDKLGNELINDLHRWRRMRERQRALPSSLRQASRHCLHTALLCCLDFLDDSMRLDPLTHQRQPLSGLVRASRHQSALRQST